MFFVCFFFAERKKEKETYVHHVHKSYLHYEKPYFQRHQLEVIKSPPLVSTSRCQGISQCVPRGFPQRMHKICLPLKRVAYHFSVMMHSKFINSIMALGNTRIPLCVYPVIESMLIACCYLFIYIIHTPIMHISYSSHTHMYTHADADQPKVCHNDSFSLIWGVLCL